MTNDFAGLLLEWYRGAHRDLPWRRTRDPYAIWVSEIMLQQTRVAAVIPFYHRFLQRFPTMKSLAEAKESDLLASWAGLGYYSRVRNMQRAARGAEGSFPTTYPDILALPGIGAYTAAAVASIALGLPHAAVDGNVLRVLSRVSNDPGDIASADTKARIAAVAENLLDRQHPGEFNQAMMELGATVCLPRDPQCLVCPVQPLCESRKAGTQHLLPVKRKGRETIRLRRVVYVVEKENALLFWQRPADSKKLAGFWELPEPEHLVRPPDGTSIGEFQHSITNHSYTFEVRTVETAQCRKGIDSAWLRDTELKQSPVSTTAKKALHIYQSSVKSPPGKIVRWL